MKGRLIGICLFCIFLATCAQKEKEDGFTISGEIEGIEDGTVVRLMNLEEDDYKGTEVVRDTVRNGTFTLKGRVESPMFARMEIVLTMEINGQTYPNPKFVAMMVDNSNITVKAEHLDSIPFVYEFKKSPLEKEMNILVEGGKPQQEYAEYRKELHPLEWEAWKLDQSLRKWLYFSDEKNQDSIAYYRQLCRDINKRVTSKEEEFIKKHPDYSISVYLIQKRVEEPFVYTVSELDDWMKLAGLTSDTARLGRLEQTINLMKTKAQGHPFIDFEVCTDKDEVGKMSEFIKPGTYSFIDFWASWCGPCREAIPQVKALKQKYGDKLNVYSVSIDKDESEWRKAMKKEQMSWMQFIIPEERKDEVTEKYSFRVIPYLVLIAPDGSIAYATVSVEKMTNVLEDSFGF